MEQATATETPTKQPNPKREALKVLSAEVAPLVERGDYETINAALINEIYTDEENTEFKTFSQWVKDGYQVKKGSKAFLVWARPNQKQKPEEEATPENEDGTKFFPLCYLFSNAQVTKQ